MKYPKVLIVGQYFHTEPGGWLTMVNLFKGWDKEKIAAAAENIYKPDFSICDKYYQLGSPEIIEKFPFNLSPGKKQTKSGVIVEKDIPVSSSRAVTGDIKKAGSKTMYLSLLHFTGLFHYKSRYKISNEFLSWIKEYSPDIIYSQLSNIKLIRLVSDLHKLLGIPVAIHIMDDWPVTISKKGLFQSYWQKTIDKEFRSLLSESKVLLSIGEAMSDEYKARYGYRFIPFHNPIDIKRWDLFAKKDREINDTFILLYAGRVGAGIQNCFLDIAEAVGSLNLNGFKIEIHIYTTTSNPILDELAKFAFVKLNGAVAHSELPRLFSGADLLLLPNDFDSKSISFLKFSMPTKASEYMVSGTPILLYSSIETAVTKHALKYRWAYVVSEQSAKKLESAISELYEKKELRSKLVNTAKEYAINNYDGVIIREQFRKALFPDER